jgi:hypothetical protein
MRNARRFAAFVVAFLLFSFAPGLAPYEAAAQVFAGAAASASSAGGASGAAAFSGPSGVPVLPPSAVIAPALALESTALSAPSSPALRVVSPAAAVPAFATSPAPAAFPVLPASAVPTAAPAALLSAAPSAIAVGAATVVAEPSHVLPTLSAAAADLGQAQAAAQLGLLDRLFEGVRLRLGLEVAVPPFEALAAPAAEPSGKPAAGLESAAAPVSVRMAGPGLQPGQSFLSTAFTPEALERSAVDSTLPLDQRKSSLSMLAISYNPGLRGLSPEGIQVLERVAAANPDGGAADYEVHRAALRALAEQGVVKSLRPISRLHADEILASLAVDKPKAAVFDYDDTLAPFREPVSPEIAAGLAASNDRGVRTAILTDRPDVKKSDSDASIIDSLAPMTPEQKAKLLVGADSGARVVSFDATGAPVLARDANLRFTDAERAAISAASAATAEKFGRYEYNGKEENLGDFKWVRFLPLGMSAETVQEAARFMQAQLDRAGASIVVAGRQAADAKNPSYLTISLLDKTVGIKALRETFAKDGVETAAGESMLIVGDSFFGTRTVDSDMSKAAPGALTIAVGGVADPRVENAFVWPTKGRDASLELLTALGRSVAPKGPAKLRALAVGAVARLGHLIGWDAPSPAAPGPDEPINMKTLAGLVLQSVPSMAAYMLVTLAFVAVATSTAGVGWAGYGLLMSLSPMAGIAAAIVMGQAVKNMSARNAMALNTLLRVVSLMALPTFHFFGLVNFGTLLVGAMAEGFLLSSIMTTQGSFLRVLFPSKQLGNINSTLFMMFPFVQMILGALLSIGRFADVLSPFAIFAGAAAVNLALVPVIWKTIPNIKLAQGAAVAAPTAPARPLAVRVAAFARANWKPALALAAAVGLFSTLTFLLPSVSALGASLDWGWLTGLAAAVHAHPALTAPLPIVAALTYWISRTDAFRALVRGEARESSPAESALTARRDALAAEIGALRRGAENQDPYEAAKARVGALPDGVSVDIVRHFSDDNPLVRVKVDGTRVYFEYLYHSESNLSRLRRTWRNPSTWLPVYKPSKDLSKRYEAALNLAKEISARVRAANGAAVTKNSAASAAPRDEAAPTGLQTKEKELASITDELGTYRRRQLWTVGLLALSTMMYYPLYLVAAPNIAGILAGPHKIELASQFLGSLFLGGMISVSARTKLPEMPIPLIGGRAIGLGSMRATVPATIGVHRLIQAAVVATAGLWMLTKVFPGALLVAAGAMAAAAGLIKLTSRVTDRGWLKFVGVGFAAVWLPFVVWTWPALLPFLTVKTAMYLAMLAAGVVNGPSINALYTYLYRSTKPSENSRVGGVSGSFFNAAISTGYALLAIASGFLHPAYPAVLAALGVINLIIGGVFWRAPASLPGLSGTLLEPRKPAAPGPKK